MKHIKLFEEYIVEKNKKSIDDSERVAITLDGTSSAGKSYTAKNSGIKTKTRWKQDKDGNYIKDNDGNFVKEDYADDEYQTIALDDYWGDAELNDPNSPENQARWDLEKNDSFFSDEEREFSKKSGEFACNIKDRYDELAEGLTEKENKLKSGKNDDGSKMSANEIKELKDSIKKRKEFLSSFPKPLRNHPDWDKAKAKAEAEGQEFQGGEPQRFYMAQEYKQSKSKNIMFDDIRGDVSHYLPKGTTKTVLLHAPMDKLVENIERREKDDPRDPKHVFDDYAQKFEFTKKEPSESTGQPGKPIKKKDIIALLKKSMDPKVFKQTSIDDEWIENFTKSMGLDDDNATYYVKVKDDYVKQNKPIIINADKDNQKTFDALKNIVKEEEKRVKSGKKKVGEESKKAEEEVKDIKDTTSKSLFRGIDPKIAKQIADAKVPVAMPNGKKKVILTSTLMDFVPIDLKEPKEAAMVKAQEIMYMKINKMRIDNKLKHLIPFEDYIKRNVELAKDNKDYQERIKAKALRAMKNTANENYSKALLKNLKHMKHIKTFEGFLNEGELNEAIKREPDGGYIAERVPFDEWLEELIETNAQKKRTSIGVGIVDYVKKLGIDLKKLTEDNFFDVLSKHPKAKVFYKSWRDSDTMGPLYEIDDTVKFAKGEKDSYLSIQESDGMIKYGEWESRGGRIFASISKNPGDWMNKVQIGSRFD